MNVRFSFNSLWVVGVALALLLLPASGAWKTGDSLPALGGFGLSGAVPDTSGQVVLVDFWASWCGPCKASFPVLDRIYKQYKDQGFVVLGVSVDEEAGDMNEFLDAHPVSFPTVLDALHKVVEAAGVSAMPTSFLVDRNGVIKSVHTGFRGAETENQLLKEIAECLGAAGGAP
jgi:thiol-disulfide isomerase/thioredoxin